MRGIGNIGCPHSTEMNKYSVAKDIHVAEPSRLIKTSFYSLKKQHRTSVVSFCSTLVVVSVESLSWPVREC